MSVVPSAGNGKITVPSILERKSGVPSQNSALDGQDYLPDCVRLSDGAAPGRSGCGRFAGWRFTGDGGARVREHAAGYHG